MWNNLPDNDVTSQTLNTFKYALDRYNKEFGGLVKLVEK